MQLPNEDELDSLAYEGANSPSLSTPLANLLSSLKYNTSNDLNTLIFVYDIFDIFGTQMRPVKKKHFGKLQNLGYVSGTFEECYLTELGKKVRDLLEKKLKESGGPTATY